MTPDDQPSSAIEAFIRGSRLPYEITFEDAGRGAVTRFTGLATGTELIASAELVYRQDEHHRLRYQIADFTGASSLEINAAQLRTLAFIDQRASQHYPGLTIAIVGTRKLFRGAESRYGIHADIEPGIEIRQLESIALARAWVESVVERN